MITHTIRVRLDGDVYPITLRYGHWLPRLTGSDGTSVGTTVYLRRPYPEPSHGLVCHELIHALDFVRRWNRTPLALYGLAVAWDLAAYVWSWLRVGCRYRSIPEEVRACGEQYLVAQGAHPDIQIVDDGP